MEYIEKAKVLLDEEIRGRPLKQDEYTKQVILFRDNMPLAYSVFKSAPAPRDNALDREDLLQEAYFGLWEACLKFKEELGFKFSTFAVPTIKGRIFRALRDCSSIREPRSFKDIRTALNRLGFSLPLSEEEIDILLDEGKFSRYQILQFSCFDGVISIDDPIMNDGDPRAKTVADTVADKRQQDLYQLDEDEIEKLVDEVLLYVHVDHKDLVEEWMYAVLSGYKITQEQLAAKYKISQAQVSRILQQVVVFVKSNGDYIRQLFGV